MSIAEGIRKMLADAKASKAKEDAERIEDEAWRGFVGQTAELVFLGRLPAALEGVAAMVKSRRFPQRGEECATLDVLLRGAIKASSSVAESFRNDAGKVITIQLGRGAVRVKVTGVSGQKIMANLADTDTQIAFKADDLTLEEQSRRMGDPSISGVALARGLMAVKGNRFRAAEDMFSKSGSILSEALMAKTQMAEFMYGKNELVSCLMKVLKAGGIVVGASYDEGEWVKAVEQAKLTDVQAVALNEQREKFLVKYGMTEFAVKVAPVLLVLERRCAVVLKGERSATPGSEEAASESP